jgi:choline kinase
VKAIIFAAGRSRRLGHLTDEKPKCCLSISDNLSSLMPARALSEDILIIDLSLHHIFKLGFKSATIVTGHAEKVLREHIANKWHGYSIDFVFNPEYENRNNIYTAYLVRDLMDNETYIFNSDIVYDQRILLSAVNSGLDNFIVVDDTKALVDEDMKVLVDVDDKILRVNKDLANNKCKGEYIGIMHLSGASLAAFKASLEEMIVTGETDKYYEDALDRIVKGLDLETVSTQGYSWAEIDTPTDYQRAQNLDCVKLTNATN